MKLISFLVLLFSSFLLVGYISCQIRLNVNRGKRLDAYKTGKQLSYTQKKYNLNSSKLSVILTNVDNVYYYGDVYLGTPPKKFRINFDTGSSDFWVISVDCKTAACKKHSLYNPKKSKTFRKQNKLFAIHYGDGSSVQGRTCIDTLTIDGVKITGVQFAKINKLSGMDDEENDGIMGLGFKELSMIGAETPVDKAFNQKKIPSKLVGFWLTANTSATGSMTIGGIDESRFTGPITYIPVTKKLYWQFTINKVLVKNTTHTTIVCEKRGCETILDTGTTLIYGPTEHARSLNEALGAIYIEQQGLYFFNCSNLGSLPDVNFTMGDRVFPLSAKQYVFKYQGYCFSSFVGGSQNFWILGDVFISRYYSIFDSSNNQIGLADAIQN